MWKVVAFVLAVFILGHFAIRYARTNPLEPEADGAQIVVESQDYRVHMQRNGAVSGTYFIAGAKSEDCPTRPVPIWMSYERSPSSTRSLALIASLLAVLARAMQ